MLSCFPCSLKHFCSDCRYICVISLLKVTQISNFLCVLLFLRFSSSWYKLFIANLIQPLVTLRIIRDNFFFFFFFFFFFPPPFFKAYWSRDAPAVLTFNSFTLCPHYSVFIWEQTATCATYIINWLVFITEMKSVYCAVRTWSLNKAVCASSRSRNFVFPAPPPPRVVPEKSYKVNPTFQGIELLYTYTGYKLPWNIFLARTSLTESMDHG